MIKLSIITASYNSAETIENTIKSVIKQKTQEIEYIVIDGDSKDGTKKILNLYNDYIDIVVSEPDNGICDAFNKGIRLAHGEWIGILNSDDQYLDGALRKFLDKHHDDSDVFYGNGVRSYCNGTYKKILADPNPENLHKHMILCHPASFVKKSAYERLGNFDTSYKGSMDYELMLRLLNRGAKFQYDSDFYATYSMGGTSDNNFFNYVVKENYRLHIQDGMSRFCATVDKYKYIIIVELSRFRNKLKLNKTYRSIREAINS